MAATTITINYTAKYAAADGALLWEKRYNGPANQDDKAGRSHSLALGPNGMVAITGYSDGNSGSGSAYDYATVVYRENCLRSPSKWFPSASASASLASPATATPSSAPSPSTGPWSTLATRTAPIQGIIEYVDTNPPVGSAFYRTGAP